MATPVARTTLRASAMTSGPMPSPPMTPMLWLIENSLQKRETAHRGGRRSAHVGGRRALLNDDYRHDRRADGRDGGPFGVGGARIHERPVSTVTASDVNLVAGLLGALTGLAGRWPGGPNRARSLDRPPIG